MKKGFIYEQKFKTHVRILQPSNKPNFTNVEIGLKNEEIFLRFVKIQYINNEHNSPKQQPIPERDESSNYIEFLTFCFQQHTYIKNYK
jgi:hypothetical protein